MCCTPFMQIEDNGDIVFVAEATNYKSILFKTYFLVSENALMALESLQARHFAHGDVNDCCISLYCHHLLTGFFNIRSLSML